MTGPPGAPGAQGQSGSQARPGPGGYSIVKERRNRLRPRRTTTFHVACPAGEVPFAGGWSLAGRTHGGVTVQASYPRRHSWDVKLHNRSGKAVRVVLHAVCAAVG